MSASSTADMDPTTIPLPPSDDTHYFTSSPAKNSTPFRGGDHDEEEYESPPPTVRPTRKSKRAALANIFDTETPVVSAAFNPFRTPGDVGEQETPRARPSKRGGKYHPGTRPQETPGMRESSPGSEVHHSSRHSAASDSDGAAGGQWGTDDMDTDEVNEGEEDEEDEEDEEEELDEHDDIDRTIAINLNSSVAHQLGGIPGSVRSRRMTTRSSPGRTPAKKSSRNFNPSYSTDFSETPRPSAFTNTSVPPSLFADIQKTPFLSATSPQKLNAMHRLAENSPTSLSYDAVLKEKEDEIRRLKEMLAGTQGQQQYEDFINFSPEKRVSALPEDLQLTVKKRRSPRKNNQTSTSPIMPSGISRGFRSSPLKPLGSFEGITRPITAEERKRARRRRVTQEFRDFSAIDLNALKENSYVPPQPMAEVIEEAEEATESNQQELHPPEEQLATEDSNVKLEDPVEKDVLVEGPVVGEPMVEDEKGCQEEKEEKEEEKEEEKKEKEEEGELNVEKEEETHGTTEEEREDGGNRRSSLVVPPFNRTRQYRSSSAPPVPHAPEDMAANTFNKFSKPTTTPMDLDSAHEFEIANLNNAIAELQDKLETADVQIERLKAELIAERRLRIVAEQAREFVEMERKFGVCCEHNPGFQQPKEKLGPAAVQLPDSSPPQSYAMEENRRPKSRLGRPASRLGGDGHASRLGEQRAGDRPPTRLGGHANRNPAPPVMTKKRAREEPPMVPGKKASIPARPEKRVLSGSAAGNIMLGASNTASALSKKPEKAVGRSLRSTAGATTARPGALSRGARR